MLNVSRPTSTLSAVSFDAGLNASSAWTGAIDGTDAEKLDDASDNREEDATERPPRPARALYNFDGQPDFRELIVKAGDDLSIVKEDLAEGWSLAEYNGELGMIPRKYYIFTTDFANITNHDETTIPPTTTTVPMVFPLQPQNTGAYFSGLRQTLLGGKSLNRFSNFVTCGAEDWVLHGSPNLEDGTAEPGPEKHAREISTASDDGNLSPQKHFVDAPPSWRVQSQPFKVLVHSPSKYTSSLTGSYTMYAVTSIFTPTSPMHSRYSSTSTTTPGTSTSHPEATVFDSTAALIEAEEDQPGTIHVTVQRRFSHFVFLHTALSRWLPGIALPPLPDRQYTGRFNDDFIEARRGDLERWISRIVRHPLARETEVVVFFLSCDNDVEWRRRLPTFLAPPPSPGPSFYAHVYHPAFNLDAEDAEDSVDRFENHLRAVGQGVQGIRGVFGKVREAAVEMSIAQRALSYSVLSMITATPISQSTSAPATPSLAYAMTHGEEGDDDAYVGSRKGLMNSEGAWCWRDHCGDCLRRTKALQRMAETMQLVADSYDDHARRTEYHTQDALKDVAHPSLTYAGVIDTHRSSLSRYVEASASPDNSIEEEKATRCETVLNTTMAEFDTYHAQKGEDFDRIAKEHLDGEIAFHEQVLRRLKAARAAFDDAPDSPVTARSTTTSSGFQSLLPPGPRQPSIYERDLAGAPTRTPAPLPQPAPHVYDVTAPLRPMRDGVSTFLGGGASGLRTSGIASGIGGIIKSPVLSSFEGMRGSVFDIGRLWSSGS